MDRQGFAVFVVVMALVLAACAPAPAEQSPAARTPAASPSPAETVAQRLARLYEAAKPEGKVALYSSMNNEDAAIVLPKFKAQFPGVEIEHTRAPGEKLVQRIVTEKKAGQHLFDVFDTASFEAIFVVEQGYTQPYLVASLEDFPPEVRDRNGAWIANRSIPLVIGFNTQKGVRPGDIKGWADLCDKKYESKIAVEKDDVAVYSALRKLHGDAEAQRIVKCVAANKPSLRSGHTEIDTFLAAGEFAITFASHSHRLAPLKYEKNAAVDWVKDVVVIDLALVTLADKPPHPNAARLFIEWLTSPDGQAAINLTGRPPASIKTKPKYPDVIGDKRVYITPDMRKDFDRDAEFWRTTFGIK